MRCPYCQHTDTKVTDSRTTDEGNSIRRRRECINCGRRFTTYEIIEEVPVTDGTVDEVQTAEIVEE